MKTKLRKRYFNYACREILATPPIGTATGGPIILSEVSNSDVIMYLVAVKSLYRWLGQGRIVLLLDRDCPQKNLHIFEEHVRPWKIFHVEDQVSERCPRGGTWERILTIAQLVETDYVIQVDSDTVTKAPAPEVVDCVRNGCSFMIGTWKGQEIESVEVSAERVKDSLSRHVQILGEQHLTGLDGAESLRYARGQSSFAGFAKGSFSVERLEAFSERMETLLGEEKWSQWGSESFASNFCVANADKAVVLPWPKYASYNPEREISFDASSFLHFEGTNRFKEGAYIKTGKKVVSELLPRDVRES